MSSFLKKLIKYEDVEETKTSTEDDETEEDLRSKVNRHHHNNIFTEQNHSALRTEAITTESSIVKDTEYKLQLKTIPKAMVATGSLTMALSIIFYLGWRRRNSSDNRRANMKKKVVSISRLGISSFPGYMNNKVSDVSSTASSSSSSSMFTFSYIDVFKTSSSDCPSISDISSECSMMSSNCSDCEASSQSDHSSFSVKSLIRKNCLTKIMECEEEDDEEAPSITILETDEYDDDEEAPSMIILEIDEYDNDQINTLMDQEESEIENMHNPSSILPKIPFDDITIDNEKDEFKNDTIPYEVEGLSEEIASIDVETKNEDEDQKSEEYGQISGDENQVITDTNSGTKETDEKKKNQVKYVEDSVDEEDKKI